MKHIKRLAAPKSWAIARKDEVYLAAPLPGKHTVQRGMAAAVVLKELIPLAKTTGEVRKMLRAKDVLVDGKRILEYKHSIGLMDVVSIPELKEHFRILLDAHGRLFAHKITDKESSVKPLKIVGKRADSKGRFQVTLSDGRNLLTKDNVYKVGDTLVLEVPSQKILEHVPLAKGVQVYLMGGKHVAHKGVVERVEGADVTYKSNKGESTTTLKVYCLGLGKSAVITLP